LQPLHFFHIYIVLNRKLNEIAKDLETMSRPYAKLLLPSMWRVTY